MDSTTGPTTGPLRHEPRRIRPPFDVASHDLASDAPVGETADQWRARRHADRLAALLEPLDGVELGAYDRRIIEWLADWDTSIVGTVASLFYRLRAAGFENTGGGR
jgi:hypothetical protein